MSLAGLIIYLRIAFIKLDFSVISLHEAVLLVKSIMSLWIAISRQQNGHCLLDLHICIDFPNAKANDAKTDHTTSLERKEQGALCAYLDIADICV